MIENTWEVRFREISFYDGGDGRNLKMCRIVVYSNLATVCMRHFLYVVTNSQL